VRGTLILALSTAESMLLLSVASEVASFSLALDWLSTDRLGS